MSDKTHEVGRLAMRREGAWWVAYYAQPGTMKGAVTLGNIRTKFVEQPDRKEAFMALMICAVSDLIEERTGERPMWPNVPVPAPEHERSGHG